MKPARRVVRHVPTEMKRIDRLSRFDCKRRTVSRSSLKPSPVRFRCAGLECWNWLNVTQESFGDGWFLCQCSLGHVVALVVEQYARPCKGMKVG